MNIMNINVMQCEASCIFIMNEDEIQTALSYSPLKSFINDEMICIVEASFLQEL